jgi:aspartyl-tRNA(Asn)/glutamyl-tRNA(Gln) amidotransferase subunit A
MGVLPLSTTLDSVGWIAPSVACCAQLDAVLADGNAGHHGSTKLAGVRLGVLQGYVLDGLDREVAVAFERALSVLSRAGAEVVKVRYAELDAIPECNQQGGFSAYESYRWHRDLIATKRAEYDPRVLSRILRGKYITDFQYADLARTRERSIAASDLAFCDVNVWLTPTVPMIAPKVANLEDSDELYFRANAAMLRNPSIFNFLDCCSLSMPCHAEGEAPVGLMLSARGGDDARLLRVGAAVEAALRAAETARQG